MRQTAYRPTRAFTLQLETLSLPGLLNRVVLRPEKLERSVRVSRASGVAVDGRFIGPPRLDCQPDFFKKSSSKQARLRPPLGGASEIWVATAGFSRFCGKNSTRGRGAGFDDGSKTRAQLTFMNLVPVDPNS
jgi:hypothetical protein